MEIIEGLIILMLGMVIGWRISARFYVSLFRHLLTDLGITNQQLIKVAKDAAATLGVEAEEKVRELEAQANDGLERVEIKVELHSNTLYAFRKDNDQFLGQGTSREDLIAAMGQRMKNVRLIVVEGDQYMKTEG